MWGGVGIQEIGQEKLIMWLAINSQGSFIRFCSTLAPAYSPSLQYFLTFLSFTFESYPSVYPQHCLSFLATHHSSLFGPTSHHSALIPTLWSRLQKNLSKTQQSRLSGFPTFTAVGVPPPDGSGFPLIYFISKCTQVCTGIRSPKRSWRLSRIWLLCVLYPMTQSPLSWLTSVLLTSRLFLQQATSQCFTARLRFFFMFFRSLSLTVYSFPATRVSRHQCSPTSFLLTS